MKWSSSHFTLPILLGISLTSVSIAVIYLLYKKDEEDSAARKNDVAFLKRVAVEYKVPRNVVPAVIGRGGCVIKEVEKKTGTRIYFKEDDLESPNRICLIRGLYENTQLAQEMIKSIIDNQPIIEIYEIFVPNKACSKILGRNGETIQKIQTITGAKIIIESCVSYLQNAERRIIIKGTAEQIAAALLQIEEIVKKFKEESKDEEIAKKELFGKLESSSAVKLPTQTIKHSQSNESLSLQGTDGIMEVYVSAMESPNKFWVQIVGRGTTALDKLVSDMTAYYNEEQNRELHKLKDITPGQVCVAKFNYDEKWYRAHIISVSPEDNECEVFFMDYGDLDVVQFEFILDIRLDFLSLASQAMECCLNNVKPREVGCWSVQACERFAELTSLAQWKILTAKIEGYKDRIRTYGESQREVTVYCLDLFDKDDDKDINVALELINEGLADAVEPLLLSSRSTSRPSSAASVEKRASTKIPANSSQKMDSSVEMLSSTLNATVDIDRSSSIEEINTATPRRPVNQVEEIDLVTPVKIETGSFIENERKDSGDHLRNGSGGNQYNIPSDTSLNTKIVVRVAPAGYESDFSDDSNDLELGRTVFRSLLSTSKSRNRSGDRKKPRAEPSQTRRKRKERYRKLLRWYDCNIDSFVRRLRSLGGPSLHCYTCGRDRCDRAESGRGEDRPAYRRLRTGPGSE
nr:tudor and KH domain-containing protein homolog isoform X2 [Megalopta genalis]